MSPLGQDLTRDSNEEHERNRRGEGNVERAIPSVEAGGALSPELPPMLKPLSHEAPDTEGLSVVDDEGGHEQQLQARLLQRRVDRRFPESIAPRVTASLDVCSLVGSVIA